VTAPRVYDPATNGHAGTDVAVRALRPVVAERLRTSPDVTRPQARAELVGRLIGEALDQHARTALAQGQQPLSPAAEARVARRLRDTFLGLGGLQPLLDDASIETININGADNVWVNYRDGSRTRVDPVAESDDDLVALLRELGARAGAHERRFDRAEPELAMQLPGGARLNALMHVTDRVAVSIRLHPGIHDTLHTLCVEKREMSPGLQDLLTAAVRARRNIVVSGGPAAGKTTLLRALAHAIPSGERVVTIEDAYELNFSRTDHPNMVAMQTREPNLEGAGGYDMARLLRSCLRMTPDRVIVGEVRGPEVVQMAKAMSIGIDGSMATVHASSSRQALSRLVAYAMEPPASYSREAALALIGGAVHLVVHLDIATDGARVISSVREVVDGDGDQIATNEVYRPGPDRRATPATPLRTATLDLLAAAGFDPAALDRESW